MNIIQFYFNQKEVLISRVRFLENKILERTIIENDSTVLLSGSVLIRRIAFKKWSTKCFSKDILNSVLRVLLLRVANRKCGKNSLGWRVKRKESLRKRTDTIARPWSRRVWRTTWAVRPWSIYSRSRVRRDGCETPTSCYFRLELL